MDIIQKVCFVYIFINYNNLINIFWKLTEVDGVPPEGALTITLLSIGDVVSDKVLVGTIIKSRSLLVISAVIDNDY